MKKTTATTTTNKKKLLNTLPGLWNQISHKPILLALLV